MTCPTGSWSSSFFSKHVLAFWRLYYTVEVRNRLKGLDLIVCLKNYGWRFKSDRPLRLLILYSIISILHTQRLFYVDIYFSGIFIFFFNNLRFSRFLWVLLLHISHTYTSLNTHTHTHKHTHASCFKSPSMIIPIPG